MKNKNHSDFEELINIKSKIVVPAIIKLLKLDKVEEIYRSSTEQNSIEFVDDILSKLKIRYELNDDELKNIPKNGPFILVSNHPYGGIDGLILLSILLKERPDFKVMANYLLENIPQLKEHFVIVDPFENRAKKSKNIAGIKKCMTLLKDGTPIGIFPSGEVSSFKTSQLKVSDKIWNPVVGKMIMKSEVKVVPIFFSGHNSLLFNILGLIHPRLRTAKLPSELFNKRDAIKVRIGKPLSVSDIKQFEDPDQLLRFLRAKTYSLSSPIEVKHHFLLRNRYNKQVDEIIAPVDVELLKTEIEYLRNFNNRLFTYNNFEIFFGNAPQIPNILKEISRLREITFREIGEGTDHSYDSDEFDLHYKHLFLWDNEANKIAGAYRIGEGDKLFERFKKKGFYLNQLFRFKKEFNPIFISSLEIGRSFIVKEYQRKPYSLLLLWKGINELVKRSNTKYEYLIGPVSISNKFSDLSKDILVDHIRKNYFDKNLAEFVKPRKRFKYKSKGEKSKLLDNSIKDLKMIDQLISDIEPDQSKTPVLVKKYLAQNAKIISFNVDPKFNHSLDGLLILKLEDVPESTFDMLK